LAELTKERSRAFILHAWQGQQRCDNKVSTPTSSRRWRTPARDAKLATRRRPWGDPNRHPTVDAWNLELGAEDRLVDSDWNIETEIVSVTLEETMVADDRGDVEIASLAAMATYVALGRHTHSRAVRDTRRNLNRDLIGRRYRSGRLAFLAHPPPVPPRSSAVGA
jgi:hypothetical protein